MAYFNVLSQHFPEELTGPEIQTHTFRRWRRPNISRMLVAPTHTLGLIKPA